MNIQWKQKIKEYKYKIREVLIKVQESQTETGLIREWIERVYIVARLEHSTIMKDINTKTSKTIQKLLK